MCGSPPNFLRLRWAPAGVQESGHGVGKVHDPLKVRKMGNRPHRKSKRGPEKKRKAL